MIKYFSVMVIIILLNGCLGIPFEDKIFKNLYIKACHKHCNSEIIDNDITVWEKYGVIPQNQREYCVRDCYSPYCQGEDFTKHTFCQKIKIGVLDKNKDTKDVKDTAKLDVQK